MNYKVEVTEQANAEFKEIHEYLKLRFGKKSSTKFKASFVRLIKALEKNPFQYPSVPERAGVRKCSAMTPTLVFYEVIGREVTISYLRDGRQQGIGG